MGKMLNLIFMKSLESAITFEMERQVLKTGILLTERMYAFTPTMVNLRIHTRNEEMGEKSVLHNYKYYFTEEGNGHSAADLDEFYSDLKKLRSKKIKNKEDIINLGRMEKSMRGIRKDMILASDYWVKNNKLESLLKFVDDDSLLIYDALKDKGNVLEENFDFLLHVFCNLDTANHTHILCSNQNMTMTDSNAGSNDPKTDPELIFSIPLFYLPCLDSLSHSQMRIFRNELLEALPSFYKMVQDMKMEFSEVILTAENLNETDARFDELVNPHVELLREIIHNNIYIQQIANSSSNHKTYEVSISYTKVKNLQKMYEKRSVISPIQEEMLLEKIALKTDLNSVAVFFYMGEIKD